MNHFVLYTYRNLNELRRIQAEHEVYAFVFGKTKDLLDLDPAQYIDITALIYFLQTNKNNIEPTYINLSNMAEDTVVLVEDSLAEETLELLPLSFFEHKSYFEESEETQSTTSSVSESTSYTLYPRQKVYKYHNAADLDKIIRYAETHDIPIATFSRASGELRDEFEKFNRSAQLALLDLTSVSYAIEGNKSLIYPLEQFLSTMPNIRIIAQTVQIDTLLDFFPLYFDGQEPLCKLLPDLTDLGTEEPIPETLKKVTDLQGPLFDSFIAEFDRNLIGHCNFKNRFQYVLKNFISLNKVNEQKILSIFLFGASGIGKTEVARLIANGLLGDSYLAKINFQNYSSQDALNSLIGSPAGYVGCNHGELSEKIQKSKVGVLLCDEFEKTTRPVFSFFLELLEEGRFTDSMAREYDMNGYIVVFTSNLSSEAEYKKIIPPELQTRFDLVCEFEEPSAKEKAQFLQLLLEKAQEKYPTQFTSINISEQEKQNLFDFDYSKVHALRDLKRIFNNRLMDLFNQKGVN